MFPNTPQINYKEAISRASLLCSQSEKCKFDIELKLREWQLTSEEIQKVIDYLVDQKFIDENRYAHSYVSDKLRFNKWGKIKLSYFLKQKKVDDNAIRDALAEIPDKLYHQILHDLMQSKFRITKGRNRQEIRNKLVSFAQTHGFEFELSIQEAEKLVKNEE